MIPRLKRDTRIPRKAFLWLTAALVFTVPPMFGALALWVPVLFLGVLGAKFWTEPRDYRLRSTIWKLLLGALALGAVFATYGSVKGIEPGVSIVVVLTTIKIIEAHSARDFQALVYVGWMLCLCGLFVSQDFATAICELMAFSLLLVALIEFYGQSSTGSLRAPLGTASKILVPALPLIALLFVVFPRVNFAMRMQMPDNAGSAGFSGQLSPGSVSSLAESSEIAFRAEFPDGRIPRADGLYWRGVVLSRGNALQWWAESTTDEAGNYNRRVRRGVPIRQWITLEPHGNNWMFALDWPIDIPSASSYDIKPGNYLSSRQPIRDRKKYEVISFPDSRDPESRPGKTKSLEVPSSVSPAVRELAQSWKNGAPNPAEVVRRGLRYFKANGFRYSLSPGSYQSGDLEEFLFHRRVGFCEHYAASFATLMRLSGIPARVVLGYLGGEYNEWGNFFVIRQSDSHAWCELWLSPNGWTRVDPTSVVAPDRVNLGFSRFLERRATSVDQSDARTSLARSQLLNTARLAWQAVNYAWDTRVLGFDQAAQVSLLSSFSDFGGRPFTQLIAAVAGICLLLAVWLGWARLRNQPPRDRVKKAYRRFCDKLVRMGANRSAVEGPLDFANRAATLLPEKSAQIHEISNIYVQLRYSGQTDAALQNRLAREVKAFA